jgi:hypothetical protein
MPEGRNKKRGMSEQRKIKKVAAENKYTIVENSGAAVKVA